MSFKDALKKLKTGKQEDHDIYVFADEVGKIVINLILGFEGFLLNQYSSCIIRWTVWVEAKANASLGQQLSPS